MKYRKKPIVIDAFKYDGDLINSVGKYYVPKWAEEASENGVIFFHSTNTSPSEMFIKTLEGEMMVTVGDYVIKGVNGEIYPCKPDIFEKTYDKV